MHACTHRCFYVCMQICVHTLYFYVDICQFSTYSNIWVVEVKKLIFKNGVIHTL